MRNIKLANGDIYPVSRCGANETILSVTVTGDYDLLDLVLVFGHEENVMTIEHYFDGTTTDHIIFEGYTALVAACAVEDGVTLTLEKR